MNVKIAEVKSTKIRETLKERASFKNEYKDEEAIRRLVNIMICNFMANNPRKNVGSIEFVAFTTKAKPNTKVAVEIEQKQIILKWLDENSANYRRRKSREATANSYVKSITMYFALVINKVSK